MEIISGDRLNLEIKNLMKGTRVWCAVAFWGKGSEKWIGSSTARNVRVICNLTMGGTNPEVIRQMIQQGIEIRKHDKLHAKIYIGDKLAILTSANASINGLGSEDGEIFGWLEAGTIIPLKAAESWFESLWAEVNGEQGHIQKEDLEAAEKIFRMHKQIRPSTQFENYDFSAEDFPLVEWMTNGEFEVSDHGVLDALGSNDQDTKMRVAGGVDVLEPSDLPYLKNRWILRWQSTKNGASRKNKPWFVFTSDEYVDKGGRYKGENVDMPVIPLGKKPPPIPFDVSSSKWHLMFNNLIGLAKYKTLSDHPGLGKAFFEPRIELMREFWLELQKLYKSDR